MFARKVLVVDDDAGTVETLADILRTKHYEVATAHSGGAGVARIQGNGFRAVVMDIVMPELNGVQVLQLIKPIVPPKNVILMTAYSRHELIEEARREGVLAVLPKPLDIDLVLTLLERITRATEEPRGVSR